MRTASTSGTDRLTLAAGAFLSANLLHGADHVRQGLSALDASTRAGGALLTAAAVAVVVLAVRRHHRAAVAGAAVGFTAAALVTAAHVLPHWSALSTSYVDDVAVDALSWVVVLLEIVTALVLGIVAAARSVSRQEEVALHG